ncbi:hypothetical protein NFI95_15415 [Acetobacteraceae bacterium KSS8]|uniref:Uncharacterized protein n=1 Tax=Endosaccharibacter trunci TaxID=2812733 RepID=A0ABT1WAC7_9PROT|nr:hypothetical protein [Acetobacteraceae bacterium KSS8]
MSETFTIFLATDGRHTIIGRGDAVEASSDLREAVEKGGVAGWIAIMTGHYYRRDKVKLARVHALGGATDGQWDAAVEAFDAIRRGEPPAGVPVF